MTARKYFPVFIKWSSGSNHQAGKPKTAYRVGENKVIQIIQWE